MVMRGFPDSSVCKESACITGGPSLTTGSERSTGEGIGYPLQYFWACGSADKESACKVENWVSIPGLERSPGEGTGYLLQYSGLENSE